MFKVNNKDNRIFIANFKHISHLVLVFLLLTLNTVTLNDALNTMKSPSTTILSHGLLGKVTTFFNSSEKLTTTMWWFLIVNDQ